MFLLKDVPQPLKFMRVKEEGEERGKMCCLIDLVSTLERLAWAIIQAFGDTFTVPKQHKGPYFSSCRFERVQARGQMHK